MHKIIPMSQYNKYRISNVIRNSEVLGFEYYQEYFLDSQDFSIGIVNEEQNELVAFLPLWREGNTANCYRKAFLGECVGDINKFIEFRIDLLKYLRINEINSVTFRSLDFVENNVSKIFPQACLDFEIPTSIVDLNNFTIHKMRKRNLASAQAAKLNFTQIEESEISDAWGMMTEFLERKQIPHLSLSRIEFLLRDCNGIFEMWKVKNDSNEIQAVAFTQKIGKVLRVPNYFAKRDCKGAIEVLLLGLFKKARIYGMEYVDLGISIDPITEREVSGIVDFKRSLGAREGKISHFKCEV